MNARSWQCVALLFVLGVSPLAAQYARAPGDTLRYLERTVSTVDMQTPNGPVNGESNHEATVAVTFGADDSATGWYEALRVEQSGPMGTQSPSTDALLHRPFELSFDPFGRISTRTAPEIPPEIRSISDLSRQFDDFFISLPQGALAVGTEWSDTTEHGGVENVSGGTFESDRVRTYRVERDTVIDGARGFVIHVDQTIEIRASGEVPGQELTTRTSLRGAESGIAVFLPEEGVLQGRQRDGQLEGSTVLTGAMGEFELPQRFSYESRITLQR